MSTSPVSVREDAEYQTAFRVLENSEMHHLPVTNASEEVVGILALRDLQLAARFYREAPVEIAEVMHTPVMTVSSGSSLTGAVDLMMKHRIGCLPVLDDENHLAGVLTETDLFRALREALNDA